MHRTLRMQARIFADDADPLLWWASLTAGEHSFGLIIRRTQAAELKPDTFYWNLSLKSPASTWLSIQFNLFKTLPLTPTDHVVLLRPSGSRTLNMGTAMIRVRLQLGSIFIRNNSFYLKHSLQCPRIIYYSHGRVEAGHSIWELPP